VFGSLEGRRLAFLGDGNNVACSLAIGAALMKVPFVVSSPAGYELKPDFLHQLKQAVPDADISLIEDPRAAVADADVIYTDVWASMGQESESAARKRVFAPYIINQELMAAAASDAKFMHCLPAKRGLEVTDEVLDGPQSIAFQQAENRMHIAKAVLVWLLGDES
jgi:ornithine carbamoyltransferase